METSYGTRIYKESQEANQDVNKENNMIASVVHYFFIFETIAYVIIKE